MPISAPVFVYRDYRTVSNFSLGSSFGEQLFPAGFAIVQTLLTLGRCCCWICAAPALQGLCSHPMLQGTPHVGTFGGAQDSGKTLWPLEEQGGRREVWWLFSQPLQSDTKPAFLLSAEPAWVVILPSNYLPSFGHMLCCPPPSQGRAVLTQLFSGTVLELLSTSAGEFCCFSLNIYIGATH